MKTARRMALLAMAAAFVLAGCKGDKPAVTVGEGNPITLSYWVAMEPNVATHIRSYNEVEMYKQREKDSGVHIDFIHPAAGQTAEQFNLMIASSSLPDMIEYNWMNTSFYPGGAQKAFDDEVIIPLNDYMDSAPNFKEKLHGDGELADIYRKGSMTDSGQYVGFTALNVGNYRIFGGPVIRKDWLDELSLSVPETLEDWTATLRAFRDKKGARSPITGTSDYLYTGTLSTFTGMFDVGNRWYLDGGAVLYGPMQDAYKAYIDTMRQWYGEGLLDKEIPTNRGALVDAKILNGESGALVCGFLGGGLGRYLSQTRESNPGYDLAGAPYPVKNKGEKSSFVAFQQDVHTGVLLAITKACANPREAVKWMDYWYGDEGYKLMNVGVEGTTYTMHDGKPRYTDLVLRNPNGLSIVEALMLNCRAAAPAPGLQQAPEYLEQYYEYRQQRDALALWTGNVEEGRKRMLPNLSPTLEESNTITSIEADLSTYVSEMLWKFITGVEPMERYDAFRGEMKNRFKIEEYTKIMQSQYDRYLKR